MRRFLVLLAILVSLPVHAPAQTLPATTRAVHNFARWEKEISAYEQRDKTNPPAKGGVLFTGSSTIRMWKSLPQDFPNLAVINRGLGGSQICDATYFANRIIFPYEPKMIVLRAGGNDLHAGRSADEVFDDFKDFVATARSRMPNVPIVFVSLCPTPARWSEREANRQLNSKIQQFVRENPGLKYVETYDMSLTPDGQPRRELFIKDGLHFNDQGYKLLAERVRPVLSGP